MHAYFYYIAICNASNKKQELSFLESISMLVAFVTVNKSLYLQVYADSRR